MGDADTEDAVPSAADEQQPADNAEAEPAEPQPAPGQDGDGDGVKPDSVYEI